MDPVRTIAIDASAAAREQKTGVEWYTFFLLKEMNRLAPNMPVTLYSHRPLPFALEGAWTSVVFKRPWYGWKRKWSRILRATKPDVIFCPSDALPPSLPRTSRVVVTAHDLGWRHVPNAFTPKQAAHLESVYARYAREADHVITVSDVSKEDFHRAYGYAKECISTVWLGLENADHRWRPREVDAPEVRAVKKKYGITGPYVLSVGRLEEKKGIARALKGFLKWRNDRDMQKTDDSLTYVLAGPKGTHGYEEIHTLTKDDSVQELGYVSDEDMPALMAGADLFVFPSLYEGFGIPMLEAWACGVPVLCSELPVFSEIGGYKDDNGHTWLFTMKDATVSGWAHGFAHFYGDGEVMLPNVRTVQSQKIEKALVHVRQFTWERAAKETLNVLCNI